MQLWCPLHPGHEPSYTRPGEFILKSQPQPSATTAATPSVACWPPSPPTPWSGTPGSWSQVEQVQNLKHRKSQKGNRMPRSVRVAVLIATKTISTLQTLTGQEGTVQDQHLLPSQLMIYQASFGFDLEQNLAVTLLGNDQEANKTRSNSRMGIDMVIHITTGAMVKFIMLAYSIAVLVFSQLDSRLQILEPHL